MKKLIEIGHKLNLWLRGDKVLHFLMMFLLNTFFILLTPDFNFKFFVFGIFPILIGEAWEIIWNKTRGIEIDQKDVIATTLGGWCSLLLIYFGSGFYTIH